MLSLADTSRVRRTLDLIRTSIETRTRLLDSLLIYVIAMRLRDREEGELASKYALRLSLLERHHHKVYAGETVKVPPEAARRVPKVYEAGYQV